MLHFAERTWSDMVGTLQKQTLASEDKHQETGVMNHVRKINLNPEKDQHVYR